MFYNTKHSYNPQVFLKVTTAPRNVSMCKMSVDFLTCFVGGSHQWPTGSVSKAHIISDLFPVAKLLRSDVFIHLHPETSSPFINELQSSFICFHSELTLNLLCSPSGGV